MTFVLQYVTLARLVSSLLGPQQQRIWPTDAASHPRCSNHIQCLDVCTDTYHLMSIDASLSRPNVDMISQFVKLVKTASPAFAPPAAILGLSYSFVYWFSTAVLENMYVSLSICMI